MLKLHSIDRSKVADSNINKIIQILYKHRELTKHDIAAISHLSIPTVTNNLSKLIEDGLVTESGVAESTGGRKPVLVKLVPNSRFSLGVDISPLKVRIILTNLFTEIKAEAEFELDGLKDMTKIMNKIKIYILDMLEKNNIKDWQLTGIGFSIPGTVNKEKMILEMAPNLGVKNIDFHDFADVFDYPIYIENEANAAAYGESILGSLPKEKSNSIYISITEGLGIGIIMNGDLYKGSNHRAGEFGHMRIGSAEKECQCGRVGCWELYGSEKALLTAYNEVSKHNIQDIHEFFQKYEEKEAAACNTLDSYLEYLARGIQNIILGLDPKYIVIGGKISEYKHVLLPLMRKKVFTSNAFYNEIETKLLFSDLNENASLLGASLIPLKNLLYSNMEIRKWR